MFKYLCRHLQLKLVVVVMLGVVLAFSVIGWLRIVEENSNRLDDLSRSGQERVTLVAAASANLLIGHDYSNMEALADRVLSQRDVLLVLIKNAAGKVMVRRDKGESSNQAGLLFEAPVVFSSETVGAAVIKISTTKHDEATAAVYAKVIVDQLGYGLTLGLLIYVVASRVIVKPITQISDQMKQIINADLAGKPEPLQVSGNDEISALGRIFNDLNRKVYAAQQQLQMKVDLARSDLMTTNRELHERTIELERAFGLVEKLAITDSLTQLHNRRHFDDRLVQEFNRAVRFGEPLTLLLLDVDHFKQVNDTQGHAAGDALLQTLASILVKRCRASDIVARLGGDEFAFLLYRTHLQEGAAFAAELLSVINAHRFSFHHEDLGLSVSIGLACTQDSPTSVKALYGAADAALYEAKRDGRSCFATHPSKTVVVTS